MSGYAPRELTPQFVAELIRKYKAEKRSDRVEVRDTKVKGLALRIGPRGAVWVISLKYKNKEGKQAKVISTIGALPETGVMAARKAAETKRAERNEKGSDFAPKKLVTPSTLRQAFDRWLAAGTNGDPYAKQLRPRTVDWANQLMDTPLASYADHPLPWFFDPANLKDLSDAVRMARTPNVAAKCLELIRIVGNWNASIYGAREGLPAAMPRGRSGAKPDARDTEFEANELPALYRAVCALETVRRDAWLLALLTGQRAAIIESMRWADYDSGSRTLTIDSERDGTKGAPTYRIPVSSAVASLLNRRLGENAVLFEGSPYIFPSNHRDHGYIDLRPEYDLPVPRRYAAQLAKRGIKRGGKSCHVHAMRHTFDERSLKDIGVSLTDLQFLTGQKPTGAAIGANISGDAVSERIRRVQETISENLLRCMGLAADHRFNPDIETQDAAVRAA